MMLSDHVIIRGSGWTGHLTLCGLVMMSRILVKIDYDNGLSLVRHQAIIYTNANLLLVWPKGTTFSVISIKIQRFSFRKNMFDHVVCKMASILFRPLYVHVDGHKFHTGIYIYIQKMTEHFYVKKREKTLWSQSPHGYFIKCLILKTWSMIMSLGHDNKGQHDRYIAMVNILECWSCHKCVNISSLFVLQRP